jgi:hypothetical protein
MSLRERRFKPERFLKLSPRPREYMLDQPRRRVSQPLKSRAPKFGVRGE